MNLHALVSSILLGIFLTAFTATNAAELKGTVRTIAGDVATVALDGDQLPNTGDKAEIFFKLDGVDEEISVATASVAKVERDSVQLKIANATGEVAKDQLVRIASAKTQPRSAVAATDSSGRDPSFAFVDMSKLFLDHPKTKEFIARSAREKVSPEETLKARQEIVDEVLAAVKSGSSGEANLLLDQSGSSLNGVPLTIVAPNAIRATRGLRIGLVDMSRIFAKLERTKIAETKINAARSAAKQEYDARAARKEEIKEWTAAIEKRLGDDAAQMRNEITKAINDAITAKVAAEQTPLVFDVSGKSAGGELIVVSASGIPDFTDEIIATLNSSSATATKVSLADSSALRFACVDLNRVKADAVRKTAEKEGYNLVLDSSGKTLNGLPALISSRGLPDLTDKVGVAP